MKKVITSLVILLAAAAQAEFMMWSVSDSQFSNAGLTEEVAYMRVGYVTANGKEPAWSGTALTTYYMDGTSSEAANIDYVSGAKYKVDLTNVAVADYSFYIELLNSSGQVIGRTGNETTHTYTTYSELSSGNYVSTGDIGTVPTANVWHGGGSFTACPEPSSMALLALGAGLVGLRRKLKKNRKARRANA